MKLFENKKLTLAIRPESFILDKIISKDDTDKYDKNLFQVLSVFKQTREELAHIKIGTKELSIFLPDDSDVKKDDKVILSIKQKGCFIFNAQTGERLK